MVDFSPEIEEYFGRVKSTLDKISRSEINALIGRC